MRTPPLHVGRHRDELKVALVALKTAQPTFAIPYQFFIVALARSTPTLVFRQVWHFCYSFL